MMKVFVILSALICETQHFVYVQETLIERWCVKSKLRWGFDGYFWVDWRRDIEDNFSRAWYDASNQWYDKWDRY